MALWLPFLLLLLVQVKPSLSWTKADERKYNKRANATVITGVILGDVAILRRGLHEGGYYNTILTSTLGRDILRLGQPYIDFPVCPAIHLSFFLSDKEHLDIAMALIRMGSDINDYRLPDLSQNSNDNNDNISISNSSSLSTVRGYPPAILYSLGLGRPPSNIHAAFLHRIIESIPNAINQTKMNEWRKYTGNPPLLHIAVSISFFDGAYVIIEYLKVDINEQDHRHENLTALHIAAYYGDSYTIRYLLSRGANRMIPDSYGRIPIHYAAMQGCLLGIEALLSNHKFSKENLVAMGREMIQWTDRLNNTVLDYAAVDSLSLNWLFHWILNHSLGLDKNFHIIKSTSTILQSKELETKLETKLEQKSIRTEMVTRYQSLRSQYTQSGWKYYGIIHQVDINYSTTRLIDVVYGKTLTSNRFLMEYYINQRPVHITDSSIVSGNKIWAYYYRDLFIERYRKVITYIISGEKLYASNYAWNLPTPLNQTLKDWVENHMNKDHTHKYLNETNENNYWEWIGHSNNIHPSIIHHDLQTPDIFKVCYKLSNKTMKNHEDSDSISSFQFYFGSIGSGVPMHSHNATWNLLLTGQKHWYLLPPGYTSISRGPANEIGDFSVKSIQIWKKQVLFDLRREKKIYETIQYPGDVIYIPHGWSHATYSYEDTISLSQEICPILHSDARIQPLGKIIYGGRDQYRGLGHYKAYRPMTPKPKRKSISDQHQLQQESKQKKKKYHHLKRTATSQNSNKVGINSLDLELRP